MRDCALLIMLATGDHVLVDQNASRYCEGGLHVFEFVVISGEIDKKFWINLYGFFVY
jgi:hypothetical protein